MIVISIKLYSPFVELSNILVKANWAVCVVPDVVTYNPPRENACPNLLRPQNSSNCANSCLFNSGEIIASPHLGPGKENAFEDEIKVIQFL